MGEILRRIIANLWAVTAARIDSRNNKSTKMYRTIVRELRAKIVNARAQSRVAPSRRHKLFQSLPEEEAAGDEVGHVDINS